MMLPALAQIHHDDMVPIIAMSIGGGIAVVAVLFGSIRGMALNVARAKSRREVAAYIAEGSMTPQEGERILNAGRTQGCGR